MIRTHPLVEEILADLSPEYSRATAAEATIYEWLEQPRPSDGDPGVVAKAVYAAAREGADPGPEMIAGFAQTAAAQRAWDDYRVGLVNAAQLAREDRAGAIRSTTDQVLNALDARLQTLAGQVRHIHTQLAGATTAQQAIAAGSEAITAWQTLTDLAGQYDELRAAQAQTVKAYSLLEVSKAGFTYNGSDVADLKAMFAVGLVADHLDVEPRWLERRERMSDVIAGVHRGSLTGPAPATRLRSLDRQYSETQVMTGHLSMFWQPPANLFERADAELLQLLAEWTARPARPVSAEVGWVDSADWWPRHDDHVQHLLRICTTASPWIPTVGVMRQAHHLAIDITRIADTYDKTTARGILSKLRDHAALTTPES